MFKTCLLEHTVEIGRPNKGDVDAQVPMVGGAVKTEVDTERYRRPCGVLLPAVKAYLQKSGYVAWTRDGEGYFVGRLRLEFLEDLLRLRFCSTHGDCRGSR